MQRSSQLIPSTGKLSSKLAQKIGHLQSSFVPMILNTCYKQLNLLKMIAMLSTLTSAVLKTLQREATMAAICLSKRT
jgi:hypothetical protein